MTAEPHYKHDCDNCVFLGSVTEVHTKNFVDLYYCSGSSKSFETIIARYSDDLEDYSSGLELCDKVEVLRYAYNFAIDQGFLTGNKIPKIIRW